MHTLTSLGQGREVKSGAYGCTTPRHRTATSFNVVNLLNTTLVAAAVSTTV